MGLVVAEDAGEGRLGGAGGGGVGLLEVLGLGGGNPARGPLAQGIRGSRLPILENKFFFLI